MKISILLNLCRGQHNLIYFAETCNSTCSHVEKGLFKNNFRIFDRSFRTLNESGVSRLVRTTCKALARGADEKSGKHRDFVLYANDFLHENDMLNLPVETFHGNRFNILFESAAAVSFLKRQNNSIFKFKSIK